MRQRIKAGRPPESLAPCPASPNCVSSQADQETQRVAPFPCGESCGQTLDRLRRLIDRTPGARIIVASPTYLHAEYTSAVFRFVDDLELLADEVNHVVQVRSASRIGRWDLGANRRRVEALRRQLARPQR